MTTVQSIQTFQVRVYKEPEPKAPIAPKHSTASPTSLIINSYSRDPKDYETERKGVASFLQGNETTFVFRSLQSAPRVIESNNVRIIRGIQNEDFFQEDITQITTGNTRTELSIDKEGLYTRREYRLVPNVPIDGAWNGAYPKYVYKLNRTAQWNPDKGELRITYPDKTKHDLFLVIPSTKGTGEQKR